MSEPTDPKAKHWCRHSRAIWHWVATACGRLSVMDRTVGDPSEACCDECGHIWRLLEAEQARNSMRTHGGI